MRKANGKNEPLFRLVKLDSPSWKRGLAQRALALLLAMVCGALLLLVLRKNPVAVYWQMIVGSVGTKVALTNTIRMAIPLLITTLGITVAFKLRYWNIGGEGQVCLGAIAATYFALNFVGKVPSWLLFVIMFAAGALLGGLWAAIPAYFKAKFNTNETLFTLMLNYVAVYIIQYLREGPWMDPQQTGFPQIPRFPMEARLPKVLGVHVGWIIALVLVVLVYVYLRKTKHGYEIAVVGESMDTARYAGMDVKKIILRTIFISGALCGVAGMVQVSGADFTLTETVAGGVGFTAITVAWLAKLNPALILVVSFLFSMLEKGANSIQTVFNISNAAADVLTGIILFFMLGCEFFIRYRVVFRKKKQARDLETAITAAVPAAAQPESVPTQPEQEAKEGAECSR